MDACGFIRFRKLNCSYQKMQHDRRLPACKITL